MSAGTWENRASLEAKFDQALDQLWMAFQPIVNWRKREIIGYEALVRSNCGGAQQPGPLLSAAERLGRVGELGQRIRRHVVDAVTAAPVETLIFMNLHAADLNDDSLYSRSSALFACAPRIVLEVTERSSLERVADIKGRAQALRAMGFKIAIDDLGAGYAGLSSFSQLEPDIAKLDMSLIRDIDDSPQKQSIVKSMINVCRDELGVTVVCEGVETARERDTLGDLGSETQQGYFFGGLPPASLRRAGARPQRRERCMTTTQRPEGAQQLNAGIANEGEHVHAVRGGQHVLPAARVRQTVALDRGPEQRDRSRPGYRRAECAGARAGGRSARHGQARLLDATGAARHRAIAVGVGPGDGHRQGHEGAFAPQRQRENNLSTCTT